MNSRRSSGQSVVVVGSGGNIGSHLIPHLARMSEVRALTLIDKDAYEQSNLASQDIAERDIGKTKALVQSRRLKRIDSELFVEPIVESVERVPVGKLRADVILSCLDSRLARQHVNQFAWRLGVPLIDAGVEPGGLLARINAYLPGSDSPCLECAWDDRDYQALEQTYPCKASAAAPTNAPSSLGALAASLQAIECQKLLRGLLDQAVIGKQVVIDASHHQYYVTSFRRNPECRFDHEVWNIEQVRGSITLRSAMQLKSLGNGGHGSSWLRLEGKPFVTKLTCPSCAHTQSLLRLECSLLNREKTCINCGQLMIAAGFDLLERLEPTGTPATMLRRSLLKLGLRPGDIFSLGCESRLHYEIARAAGEAC